jgi:cell division protein FtsZ
MGIGSARGEGRAVQAAQKAINSPLLEASMDGAHGVLLAIAGGSDLGLFEINESASLVQESAHPEANIIFGTVIDDSLGDEVRVTVIAAGFDSGTPTHKKLDPTMVSSRSTNTVAPAQSGQVHTPPPPAAPVVHEEPPPAAPVRHEPPAQTPPPASNPPQAQSTQGGQQHTAPPPRQAAAGYANPMGSASVPPSSTAARPRTQSTGGSLPSRAVPVTDEPDDEVDVPPFMRR